MFFGNSPSDFGFLPPQFKGDVQIFFPTGVANTQWQTWTKPRGVSMVYMIAISGGGGGGGGFTRASNATGGGGGSGSCSGMATLMIPAIFLPDSLKISVGQGGQGGTPAINGNAGFAGVNSYITLGAGVTAGVTIPNVILASGINAPGGGGAGTGAAGGPAGTVPTVATIASVGPMGKLGFWPNTGTAANNGYVGLQGIIGGVQTGAVGGNITAGWNVIPFTPGASGAGINTPAQVGFTGGSISLQAAVDFADGTFTPASNFRAGGIAGTLGVPGGNGNNGIKSLKPFFNTGGTGGGSCDNAAGGNGGDGGIGCGGGGGGAGTTGGRGGNGGPGMVAIICW